MICPRCQREVPDDARLCCYCARVFIPKTGRRTRPNGTGNARRRGSYWQAEVTIGWRWDEDTRSYKIQRATRSGFKSKKDALEYCPRLRAEALARLNRGPAVAPDEPHTIAHYWDIVQEQMENAGKVKVKSYVYAYHKMAEIAQREVASLTIGELQALVDRQTSSFYPARDMKTVLSKIFDLAIRDEIVTQNRARAIVLPRLEEDQGEPWTMEEVRKQWEAFDQGCTFVGYILLMDYTGMMPGELMECRKDMIDLEHRQIIGAGKKTKKRRSAAIVFPDILVPVIEALCDYSRSDKLLCMNKDRFYREYKRVITSIGCRDLPPYSCRHTTGTALATGGNVAPAVIQKIMRHARFQSTERYIHPTSDDAVQGVNTLEKPD